MATTIWPSVVPNYSITDLIEDLDWVASTIGYSYQVGKLKKGMNPDIFKLLHTKSFPFANFMGGKLCWLPTINLSNPGN
jgi:hypothetical protein